MSSIPDQLNHIWNPTNPYLSDRYSKGYFTLSKDKIPPPKDALVGQKIRIAAILVRFFSSVLDT